MSDIQLFGRRKIYTAVEEITDDNIIEVVNSCLGTFFTNKAEMEYLVNYRKGIQPILGRSKTYRPEICNKVVVNTADQIVTFKNGAFLTSPAFYVGRVATENTDEKEPAEIMAIDSEDPTENEVEEPTPDEIITGKVAKLNDYLYTSGKQQADNEIVNWFHTVGVGICYVEPNKEDNKRKPVCAYALDPRKAFVVYSLNPGEYPVFGCNVVMVSDSEINIDCYTKDKVYRLKGSLKKTMNDHSGELHALATTIIDDGVNELGDIPIIEYTMNSNRMGAFESVLSLLDSYNRVESNRLDGVEQFIQSLCVATNCDFDEGVTANQIKESGLICLKSTDGNKSDFKVLTEQLDQVQTQKTLDSILERIYAITGIPYTGKSTGSTSDNVGAVYMRNGFSVSDTFARDTEDHFRNANKRFDKLFLKILSLAKMDVGLEVEDIDLQFSRSEVDNLLTKTQGALNLKQLGLAPEIILEKAGISNDPSTDIARSRKYIDVAFASLSDINGGMNGGVEEGMGEPIDDTGFDEPGTDGEEE